MMKAKVKNYGEVVTVLVYMSFIPVSFFFNQLSLIVFLITYSFSTLCIMLLL